MNEEFLSLKLLESKPKFLNVRYPSDISFKFSLDFDILVNSWIIFRFRGGRNNKNDWYFIQAEDPRDKGFFRLNIKQNPKIIPLLITGKELIIKYLVCEQGGIKKGDVFEVSIHNTLVQSLVEKRKKIEIFIQTDKNDLIFLKNSPEFDILNAEFDHLTLLCPSTVPLENKINCLVRAEDKYHNLVKNFSGKVSLSLTKDGIDISKIDEIQFNTDSKGIFRVNNIDLKIKGTYTIKATFENKEYTSNVINCNNRYDDKSLFWGFIHGHTLKSDGTMIIEDYFDNLKDAGLDFGTSTEHDHSWETSDSDFKDIEKLTQNRTILGEFIAFFGYEYGTWYSREGDICIYHKKENLPIFRSEFNKYNSVEKLINNLRPFKENILMITHHSALRPGFRDWKSFDNSLERLVEIYSTWGNQEYPSAEGNPIPPRYKFFGYGTHAKKRGPILGKRGCYVRDALKKGYKLGFVAGGDDHYGSYPSGPIDPDDGLYPPGIMAIWADKLDTDSLWDAMMNRKCYGTTGPRIIIEFSIDSHFMGKIINLSENSNLIKNRVLKFDLISPIKIKHVVIIRNNEVFKNVSLNSTSAVELIEDFEDFNNIALINSQKDERFIFYYLRIFLEGNQMAWSSPIWISWNA